MQRLPDAQDILQIFSDHDQYVDFLTNGENDEIKVLLVISINLPEHVVSILHELSQIDSIFVFGTSYKMTSELL